MTLFYTIQNSKGNEGWIQTISYTKANDEIRGEKYEISENDAEAYLIISKEEYDTIRTMYKLFNETEDEKYLDIIELMMTATIENNIENTFTLEKEMSDKIEGYEVIDSEGFACGCGNTTSNSGFEPCDSNGNEIEPSSESWTKPLYKCLECSKIYYLYM